jgi:hypothetical protein
MRNRLPTLRVVTCRIATQERRPLGQYELYVTEATHLGPNNLRLVRVYSDGTAFTYHHEHVEVPVTRSLPG